MGRFSLRRSWVSSPKVIPGFLLFELHVLAFAPTKSDQGARRSIMLNPVYNKEFLPVGIPNPIKKRKNIGLECLLAFPTQLISPNECIRKCNLIYLRRGYCSVISSTHCSNFKAWEWFLHHRTGIKNMVCFYD